MMKYSIKEISLYILARILMFIFCLIPVGVALWVARLIGRCAFYLDIKHKSIAYANLKKALGSGKSSKEINRILKDYFINQYENFIEVLRFPRLTDKYLKKYVRIEGKEYLYEALKQKKGVILSGVHFGNWEISNVLCSRLGFDYYILAREQKMGLLNGLLNSIRQSKGCKIQFVGRTAKNVIQLLRDNGVAVMVVDHGSENGISVDFFGTSARTPTGAVRLSLKYGCPLVIGYIRRERGPYHVAKFFPEIKLENTGHLEDDIKTNLDRINKKVEGFVGEFPDQYLWHYKRWKYSDEKKVLILSDGKAGHLHQSESVLKLISDLGFKVSSKIVKINHKNKYRRSFLKLCSLFNSRYCQGCLNCLRFSLDENSFKEITNEFADIVISAGSGLAAVNLYLKREFNAKSVCIMRPGLSRIKDFDLCILPRHDNIPGRSNTVTIDGALNVINDDYLRTQKESLAQFILKNNKEPIPRDNILGLLIGGDTKYCKLGRSLVEQVILEIKKLSRDFNMQLFISTSRRTPREIEGDLKANFGEDLHCRLMIIANEQNYPFVLGGIIGMSDILVVSGESISMVSEAASSGKYVIVFKNDSRKSICAKNSRHELFLAQLKEEGYIHLVQPEEVYLKVKEILEKKPQIIRLDNNKIVQEAISRIIK